MNNAKPKGRMLNILLILTVSLLAVIATGAVAFARRETGLLILLMHSVFGNSLRFSFWFF